MQIMKKSKGMALQTLWVAGLGFVITTIVISVGARILSTMANQTTDGNATAIIGEGMGALRELSSWLTLIALVVAAVIILMLIVRGLGGLGGAVGGQGE